MADRPLCFVLMPFGQKPDGASGIIDFDAVYDHIISPAVKSAGMEPLRADEEQDGGFIQRPMFERLILCQYTVADLTTANANVYYELGIRHAVRPHSTVLVFAEGHRLPFDIAALRGIPYSLEDEGDSKKDAEDARTQIRDRLIASRDPAVDSPIYELVEDYPDVDHTKTDVFRERVRYSNQLKERLAHARDQGDRGALRAIEDDIQPLEDQESGVQLDLLLSYRAVQAWDDMIRVSGEVSRPLAKSVLVREQLGFALNRAGMGDRAERILLDLLEERGPSSETLGILGRVYKDRWLSVSDRHSPLARGALKRAIDAYLQGFESDWRDAYPGVNAVTLMEVTEPPDARRIALLPVVRYAVERRIADGVADYWDYATRLELAVLAEDREGASAALADCVSRIREEWEPATTARNLRIILEARETRGEDVSWIRAVEETLGGLQG